MSPHIPPIQCLVTFEAVARLRSVSKTSEHLCVTVSAVSHRLRQLEAHLGFKLFARGDFTLTADGAAYLAHVRTALDALQHMTPHRGQAHQPRPTRLRVAVTPTFCRELVMPHLALFRNAYPDIDLIFQVSIPLLDVKAEPADLEVRFGSGGYTDCEHRLLMSDAITPACSPSFLHEFGPFDGLKSAAELSALRLIRSPLEPWSVWFQHCGMRLTEPQLGSQFNDLGLAYDAAASGLGVVLLRQKLGASWMTSGRLVKLSSSWVSTLNRHYLCWAPGALDRWECQAFADWLTSIVC